MTILPPRTTFGSRGFGGNIPNSKQTQILALYLRSGGADRGNGVCRPGQRTATRSGKSRPACWGRPSGRHDPGRGAGPARQLARERRDSTFCQTSPRPRTPPSGLVNRTMQLIRTFILSQILLQSILLADVQVTARFNPPRIAMGDQSQYIVEVTERNTSSKPR